ncbi:MAG: hypothetical protein PW790_09340 [Parvibaculaceae bacterium]|nr:hypothetical protein [Parvibaculaceae bacterium]
MRDLHNNIKLASSLIPAVTLAARAGAPVDRRGFQSVDYLVLVGTNGNALSASVKLELKIETSEDGTNWTPVTDSRLVQGASVTAVGIFLSLDAAAKTAQEYRLGLLGNDRYSRVSIVVTGTHATGTPIGVVALLSHASVKPAA